MHARNDDYRYHDCDDQCEDDESEDDECITLNYDDFIKYRNECSLWSSTDDSQDEKCEFDESNFQRNTDHYQQNYDPSAERKSVAQGKHSCLKLKDDYCYLDPSAYDTRVMRNLSSVDDDLPGRSYAPEFIRAALEKTESFTSSSDDGQIDDYINYDNEQMEDLDEDCYDYPLPPPPWKQISQAAQYSELTRMVENMIYNTEVVIFSKTYCPYCTTAKDTFDELDQPYTVLELDQRADGEQIQWIVEEITGGTSVPRVFVNGIFIGGGDDVQRLYESGELQEMLGFQ